MSNKTETGVCDKTGARDKPFSRKKGFCDKCRVCRYCDEPPYCQSKINHKHFGIHVKSEIEQNKFKFSRTTILRGRDRMKPTDEFD